MFWRVSGLSSASPISTILDQDECSLEELLAEDELIQECRSLNGRLMNFLGNKDSVKELLNYMLRLPEVDSEDEEVEKAKKFAWQSCEVFCCEVEVVYTILLENEDTVKLFLGAMDTEAPLHTTTAGYFGRVMTHLLLRKPAQITEVLMQHKEYVFKMVDHLEDTSITDVLTRLVGAEEQTNTQLPTDYLTWISKTGVLEKIVDRLNAYEPKRVQHNASQVLSTIVQLPSSPSAKELAEPAHLDRLLKAIVSNSGEVSVPVINVIIAALSPKAKVVNGLRSLQTPPQEELHDDDLFQRLFHKVVDLMDVLTKSLSPEESDTYQETTYGRLKPPLGLSRLKVMEIMSILMSQQTEEMMDTLIGSGLLKSCQDLFRNYPYNNLLHRHVMTILTHALESDNTAMLMYLFNDLDLCTWLMELPQSSRTTCQATQYIPSPARIQENGCTNEQSSVEKMESTLRVGYLGHVVSLSNKIMEVTNKNDLIAQCLKNKSDWQRFIATNVEPVNKTEDVMSWKCGRPRDTFTGDIPGCLNPDMLRGSLQNGPGVEQVYLEDDEDDKEEEDDEEEGDDSTVPWRSTINALTSDGDSMTGTIAMFSRLGLQESAASAQAPNLPDSSSSSSSSSSDSSDGDSSSSSSTHSTEDDDDVGQNLTVVNVSTNLHPQSERTDTTFEAETVSADEFNAFNFWRTGFFGVELPEESE